MRTASALVLILGSLALAGCWDDYRWHQTLTLKVQTPTGIKSGASTVWVRWRDSFELLPDPPHVTSTIRGEAAVVDLGEGRYLFALLRGADRLALEVFNDQTLPRGANGLPPFIQNVVDSLGAERDIKQEKYSLLVTFDDIRNPETIQSVNPNNLSASFGKGFSLRNIKLAITAEPVSQGMIERLLPWFTQYNEQKLRLNGKKCVACPVSGPLPDLLGPSHFKVGE